MFTFEADGKELRAEVTFYTAQLYESEFMGDIIQDFFGVQDSRPYVDGDGDTVARIDFTKTNWQAATKVLWAAMRTADEAVPAYTKWVKEMSGVNMWLVREELAAEIADCFFRSPAAEERAEGQE